MSPPVSTATVAVQKVPLLFEVHPKPNQAPVVSVELLPLLTQRLSSTTPWELQEDSSSINRLMEIGAIGGSSEREFLKSTANTTRGRNLVKHKAGFGKESLLGRL